MSYPATTIADWFLAKADEEGESLTPMKLLKLVYIANGFSLGAFERPLIDEQVEAWKWGPVVPELYSRFSRYGSAGVTEQPPMPSVDSDSEQVLNVVWDVYSPVSALRLSALTHQDGTPWSRTFDGSRNRVIPNNLIREYYAEEMLKNSVEGNNQE